ncbi:CopG family transcriptional regulator [Brumimicrobium aurantiacum]|uniref:CopG family transcriptional regulator n=1 Tax=Brumimicrobium aurantiacum TaxID=1737063 RepID=A0A3E1EYF7_9FLAO|nr:CopG family transcriptional regulator [Brumimicrobium aurantiacum]RFC54595.1 CopG family transcriptional regulator [Brumimicrobium aurantiacum]
MATFTSSLPDHLLQLLEKKAKSLGMPKNKLIEKALTIYLDQLNKNAYAQSFKRMSNDKELMTLAEEGMEDYMSQLDAEDEKD